MRPRRARGNGVARLLRSVLRNGAPAAERNLVVRAAAPTTSSTAAFSIAVRALTLMSGRLRHLDDAYGLAAKLLLLECHELGDEADVGRDALAALEHERVRARERPVVRVDEVRHHCRD